MDYRFFPEPDLPPLEVSAQDVAQARAALPELPEFRRARFVAEFGIPDTEAGMLLQTRAFGDFFETTARVCGSGRQAAHWMLGEVSRTLNDRGVGLPSLRLDPEALARLIRLVEDRVINRNTAREVVLPAMLAGGEDPTVIVQSKGLAQVLDMDAVRALVREVLASQPSQVSEYRAGRTALRGHFVGQAMKAGRGRLDPRLIHQALDEALEGP